MRSVIALVLGIGCQTQITQTETLLPEIIVSDSDINFGELEWGSTEYRTITVSNQGELPMGIHPITIEEEGFETNFTLTYFTETIICEDPEVFNVTDSEDWNPNLS